MSKFRRSSAPRAALLVAGALALGVADPGWAARLLYVMTGELGPSCQFTACQASVEVLDLDLMDQVGAFLVGRGRAISLAVDPDRGRCYVSDVWADGVLVFDATNGNRLGTVPITRPGDMALSSDGSALYVVSASSVVKVLTATSGLIGSGSLGTDQPLGIALSRDERVLGVVTLSGGGNPALHLFDTSSMGLLGRIPVTTTGCDAMGADVAFTDGGRALVWDPNCDRVYQVDVALRSQIEADTIEAALEGGVTFGTNSVRFSALSGRGYALTTGQGMAVLTPSPPSASLVPGFSGVPTVTALTPDERYLFVSVFNGLSTPDTLDTVDVTVGSFDRTVYTFGYWDDEHVVDMVAPREAATSLLRVARMLGVPPRLPTTIFATSPCTHPPDITTCDQATAPIDDYWDPVLPASDPCSGTLVFLAYDSDTVAAGTVDDILVTKDPLSPGGCIVDLR